MQKQKFLAVIFKIFLVFGVSQKKISDEKCAANQSRLGASALDQCWCKRDKVSSIRIRILWNGSETVLKGQFKNLA